MTNFKKITLADKEIFDKYFDINKDLNSEYNFTTIIAWQNMYSSCYAIIHDCLCIKSCNNKKINFSYPIGKVENVKLALDQLYNEYTKNGISITIAPLSTKMLDDFKKNKTFSKYEIIEKRNLFDYVYEREKLVDLSGKKLHGKRNHYNYFTNNYNFEFVDIDEVDEKKCIEKLKDLILERSLNAEEEFIATKDVFKNRHILSLKGNCLISENEIIGIILAQKHHNTVLIQIAKSDINYRGASVALFKLFLENNFTDCKHVNFMEDLGLEGLRKSKLSYNPDFFIEKYSIENIE